MPDLQDRIYCSEQIHIPPTFPYIMKLYCKAAIRTQPYDLLKWSAAYFRALANGEEPPVKERVEYPPYDSPSGLTPGYIKILINQFGKDPLTTVTAQTLFRKWNDICLDEYLLIRLIALLGAHTTVNWVNFVGVCAGFISKTLTQTMILLCELFTEEPEGGMASIPYGLFVDLYIFLANMECGPLSKEEELAQEAIMTEEDICDVADRIRRGEYEGEDKGEYIYGEGIDVGVGETEMTEIEGELGETSSEEDDAAKKLQEAKEEFVAQVKREESLANEFQEGSRAQKQKEAETHKEAAGEQDDDDDRLSDVSSARDQGSYESEGSADATSQIPSTAEEEAERPAEKKGSGSSVKEEGDKLEVAATEEEQKPPRKINLDELEDSIRQKIEERLGEESEMMMEEGDREFEELGSYLLGAAARVQKFTAETLGFRVFRRFMRQEVPGIGPAVGSEQVEKVVDFMDFWSHKQELMVMPRNIRHWMCPPLDKVPTPEP